VKSGTEAAQFPKKKYIHRIWLQCITKNFTSVLYIIYLSTVEITGSKKSSRNTAFIVRQC